MVRNVFRRLERLETRVATSTPGTIQIRVLLVHPEEGLTGVLVFETGKPTTKEPGTAEEKERIRAELEQRRAARLPRKADPTDTNDYAPA
jgi:hypothetical protein